MQANSKKNRLFARLWPVLLPAGVLPLLAFGFVAIFSHYKIQREQSHNLRSILGAAVASDLERQVAFVKQQLLATSANEFLDAKSLPVIRAKLASFRAKNADFKQVMLIDAAENVVAVDPPDGRLEGKAFGKESGEAKVEPASDDFGVSALLADEGFTHFYAARYFVAANRAVTGFLVANVSLGSWLKRSRAMIGNQPAILAALLPKNKDDAPVTITGGADPQFGTKLAAIRAAGAAATSQEIGGETHQLMSWEIADLPARLVVAQPDSAVVEKSDHVAEIFFVTLYVLVVGLAALAYFAARGVARPLQDITAAAEAIAAGQLEARAPVRRNDEIGLLATAFNIMGDSLRVSHGRARILYKSIIELYPCNDADGLMRKAVELMVTQCQGEVAWFIPQQWGREVAYAESTVFVGLRGWMWKNHRSVELDQRDSNEPWRRESAGQLFTFSMKIQGQEAGTLRVAYLQAPDDNMVSVLHALVSLIETALAKQDTLQRGARTATELSMAESVQRNIMSDNTLLAKTARVAYHYQPAGHLGGDWFFLIDTERTDSLYVVMGDVAGRGLAQGLVTTAIKGALDVIEQLLKAADDAFACGPAQIVALLETVVRRVAGTSELTMTCLAAQVEFRTGTLRVCNAGHTSPILVRNEGNASVASHLDKDAQPLLGLKSADGAPSRYFETTYKLEPQDRVVIYADGLSDAKNLKPHIFGRFLFRSLQGRRKNSTAEELKNEIIEMFRYYVQDKRVDDDVCFLVVQINDAALPEVKSA